MEAPEREGTPALYTLGEAARIVDVPPTTLRNWARGYVFKGTDGRQHSSAALITTTGIGRGPVVPFVGLSEAYVLSAFRGAGVPMQRIRPAIEVLEREWGVRAALASEQLRTDGAEILWEYGNETADPELRNSLAVVRNGQLVFRDVIEHYLKAITYRDGVIRLIRLPQFDTDVVVDPHRNFGQPTIASRGIRVDDVRSRLSAGESAELVAEDFRLDLADVLALAA
ncbi:DUF433 domain-containing protein [Luteimicrobium sp. DT211]|uniref:DUF433 domain-containing protein n=1 Tax=Luteimicrobium sp. DT211 TaxID=3393412 RepID=UPI003CF3E69E